MAADPSPPETMPALRALFISAAISFVIGLLLAGLEVAFGGGQPGHRIIVFLIWVPIATGCLTAFFFILLYVLPLTKTK